MNKEEILERTRKEIEACKKNDIEHIEKEEMVPATNYLLTMRDLKTQELYLKWEFQKKQRSSL